MAKETKKKQQKQQSQAPSKNDLDKKLGGPNRPST
ncbi:MULTISPECIES: acid-soluble spore protein SspM [Bacillaceae]|uniref:Spore protein n=1 Tax=Metabacillus idriensis TaxID=324768 RepID=A0A6I2MF03_9BACI|nr:MULTISPECIES: acid-soluble spore protein SspM [Bacillaceae]OHR68568.1 spore protein [Bacillus sp. HMSC76G11]MCM3596906.1 spore protein [Metabacillus idriensis]MDR0139755.1 acid-soluble spore protein SspM [Metabacillus idriensis]MRX55747.1 spore protein [Metabacillus idriensis]TDL82617.1 spore protein [Peribacillus frigoritolerans]